MFTFFFTFYFEFPCFNIISTKDELLVVESPGPTDLHATMLSTSHTPVTSYAHPNHVEKENLTKFENFSFKPPKHLLRRSKRVINSMSPQPSTVKGDDHRTKLVQVQTGKIKRPIRCEQILGKATPHLSIPNPPIGHKVLPNMMRAKMLTK